jgi:muramidase (phage lysozyme)
MTAKEKAILDVIAYSEGTLGASQNGYDIIVTFKKIVGWTPDTNIIHGNNDWIQDFGSGKSTAAGRYQFLGSTWKSINGGKNVPMNKDNQDQACLKLINNRLKSKVIDKRSVTIEELDKKESFDIFLQKCAPEWASLPLTKDIPSKGKKAGNGYYSKQGGKHTSTKLFEIFTKAYNIYKNQ